MSFWAGFGVGLAYLSSLHPPLSARLWSGQSGHPIVAQDSRFFLLSYFSSCRSPPRLESGAIWHFGYSDFGTGLCDSLCSHFSSSHLAMVVAILWFFAFPSSFSPRPPLQVM